MLNFFPFTQLFIGLHTTCVGSIVVHGYDGVNHVQTTVLHIEYQLVIEREVFFNTSIIINEGIKIDVTSAPTNLFTYIIGTLRWSTITRTPGS
jgi:hypothetical protein